MLTCPVRTTLWMIALEMRAHPELRFELPDHVARLAFRLLDNTRCRS
jgi:hypothetical protein